MLNFPCEYEKDAMQGKPLPLGLDIADSCLYMALKSLYTLYRNGQIDRRYGSEEKKRLIHNWREAKSKLEALNRDNEALRRTIGGASEKYRNNPSIETADALYAAFYNLPNDWRQKR